MVPTFSVLRFRFLLARVGIGSTCKPPTRCWRRWVALICVKRRCSLSACRGSHAAHGALFHTASGRPFLCNLRVKETQRRAPDAEGTEEWIKPPHFDTRVIIRTALAFVLSVAVARQWGRAAVEPRRAHGFVDAVLPVLPLLPGLNGHRWHGWAASSAAGRARLARHACGSRGSERRHLTGCQGTHARSSHQAGVCAGSGSDFYTTRDPLVAPAPPGPIRRAFLVQIILDLGQTSGRLGAGRRRGEARRGSGRDCR